MTTFHNAWLEEQDYRIRLKEISWEGYQRASLLSVDDLTLLQAVSGTQKIKRESVWEGNPETYMGLYLRLLSSLTRTDCLQVILVHIGDFLNEHEERSDLLRKLNPSDSTTSYLSISKHKDSSDIYIRIKSITILGSLIGADPSPPSQASRAILPGIDQLVQSNDLNEQEIGIQCLDHVLRQPSIRQTLWQSENPSESSKDKSNPTPSNSRSAQSGLLSSLTKLVKVGSKLNAQMQYQVGFCFWLLSFDDEIARNLNKKYNVLPSLIELTRVAVKEKVIRVLVATFRNLVTKASEANIGPMLVTGSLPLIQNLASRKWSDEELKEDLQWLKEQLQEAKARMTTYDEYSTELESGLLHWSPPHTSDEFWTENADKLNGKDYQQLKTLIRLLSESEDPIVLAVAANDLSKYVKYCDTGKMIAQRLGAKSSVMNLMNHSNPDVKYWALVSVQQLISQPWVL
ncbi:uncharacterized protein MELLADRAFT_115473 [Melampsora larici-populina 98AG31]|uniref:V-type proton ATPase subunit H n=1 Tax=Melampsora larici-populina (strain 98AG31 / pathotype 3-4-7) TaxID=747676 RepID=F4RAW4_MELLP|nr:uncharacterized protein MELLADRAFT_115473 [Melampsora larici-populina 98AG31]EGG10705.1 hypothetical protein MELLADRAFT_115473 [Melampsora larici-populina 98AG31]